MEIHEYMYIQYTHIIWYLNIEKSDHGSSVLKAYSLKKYCILWYEIPLEQDAIYFSFYRHYIIICTAFERMGFFFIFSFYMYDTQSSITQTRSISQKITWRIFAKKFFVSRKIRNAYICIKYRHSNQLHCYSFSLVSFLGIDPRLRAYTLNLVNEA